jgi:protein-L-isoaspartate O-methyltransferase
MMMLLKTGGNMNLKQDLQLFHEALLAKISATISTPSVIEAFRKVPRHLFVPAFYLRDPETPKMRWHLCTETEHPDEWRENIYADKPLITLLDANHLPMSSSSQPTLTAEMLVAIGPVPI